jgi:hypothetical protein
MDTLSHLALETAENLSVSYQPHYSKLLKNADTAQAFTAECNAAIDPLHPAILPDMVNTIILEYLEATTQARNMAGVPDQVKALEVNNIWDQAKYGLASLNKISWMLRAIKENRPVDEIVAELRPDRQDFTFNETQYRQIVEDSAKRQDMPTSVTLLQLEYFMRGLFNQWGEGLSLDAAESRLKSFLGHISTRDGADVYGAGVHIYTEPTQVETVLTQALAKDQGDVAGSTLIVGVGDGTGPDVKSLKNIGVKQFDAIDISTQPKLPEEVTFTQIDLQGFTPDKLYKRIICTGSGLLNQESLATQLAYWRKIAELLEQNGKYLYEVGALDPDQAKNYLFAAAQSFNQAHPSAMFGARNRRPEYRQPGETDETFGAHIFPDFVTKLLAKLAGLECRDTYFYQIRPDAYRALYTFQKTGEPSPLLNLILSVCSRVPATDQSQV